jgi:hypothetical protein
VAIFLEPVYLNEKMVLNCAAYLFEGYSLEFENTKEGSTETKGNLQLGLKFLQNLISPISLEGELSRTARTETRSARRYTLGGLHMVLLDELQKRKKHYVKISDRTNYEDVREAYVDLEAVLRPIDFYTLIEIVKTLAPLVAQVLNNFGPTINKTVFDKKLLNDISRYEAVATSMLERLEADYLKSGQLEMIMVHPEYPNRQLGIVDIDVSDSDPSAIRARLNDGKFHVIGKVTKYVGADQSLSLVQRTILSTVMDLLSRVIALNHEQARIVQYKQSIQSTRLVVQQLCQLEIPGPAYRIIAMSICV